MENSNKYLICDCVGSAMIEIDTNESSNSNGFVRFRGKFQEAEVKNKNGRLYRYDLLERERCRLDPIILERRLFGELDHPADSIIHLENASHLVTHLWWDNNILFGEGEILPTPAGKILETIIRCGIPVGISSRGIGNGKTDKNGTMIIDETFKLITFDVVADPSTPSAFVSQQVGESVKNNSQKFQQKKQPSLINTTNNINKNNNIETHQLIGLIGEFFKKSIKD